MANVEDIITRAREAIARARSLSARLMPTGDGMALQPEDRVCIQPPSSVLGGHELCLGAQIHRVEAEPVCSGACPSGTSTVLPQEVDELSTIELGADKLNAASRQLEVSGHNSMIDVRDCTAATVVSGRQGTEPSATGPDAIRPLNSPPDDTEGLSIVSSLMSQLSSLQHQQSHTLQMLWTLRKEQLRIRQQQLLALQGLIHAEASLADRSSLEASAIRQASSLLGKSLRDMQVAGVLLDLGTSSPQEGLRLMDLMARTDDRAGLVSTMARQLLQLLRSPSAGQPGEHPPSYQLGATAEQLESLREISCGEGCPLVGEICSICLAPFSLGEQLKSPSCCHYFHGACLEEWLLINASCPLCKTRLDAVSAAAPSL